MNVYKIVGPGMAVLNDLTFDFLEYNGINFLNLSIAMLNSHL